MDATTKVLKASTLKNKWQQTKAGLRHLLSDKALLPKFCCGNHIEVSRLFKKWQAEDLQNKPCKPFLLPEEVTNLLAAWKAASISAEVGAISLFFTIF